MSLPIPRPPAAIIFDFDGVILDSAELKTRAYAIVYAGEAADKLAEAERYQRLHGGITRRAKFQYFEQNIFQRPGDAASLDRLCAAYYRIVYDAVLACPFIAGAENILAAEHGRIDMHVVSGTPQSELIEIIERRGLTRFFKSVHGAPATKPDAFSSILQAGGYRSSQTLAVGDSMTEFLAAQESRIPFLGIVPSGSAHPFPPDVVVRPSFLGAGSLLGID